MAKKMGRPRKEINYDELEKLMALQCTEEEIADFFNISVDTLDRRCKEHYGETFAETYKKHSAKGRMSLRRYQFNLAKTNAGMAIWLGKQMLGQKEPSYDLNVKNTTLDDETLDRLKADFGYEPDFERTSETPDTV